MKINLCRAGSALAAVLLATAWAAAGEFGRGVYVLTSTNNPGGNEVGVFELTTGGTPSLNMVNMLPTGGNGGASTNAGILQFNNGLGAVANYGSNTVTQLVREGESIGIGQTINLAQGCTKPASVAFSGGQPFSFFVGHLLVVGANCAESHEWPSGKLDGRVVSLTDPTAAQIAAGQTWAAVTLADPTPTGTGSVLQLGLTQFGALNGTSATVTLPPGANVVPLGEAFWGDLLGFTPAHSPDSFAILNKGGTVFPVTGPTPPYPTNAPCWVAKGAGNIWYTGNSPGMAISIFFSDGQGGAFYKSIPLPGSPSDITVSPDGKLLAVIYSAGGEAYVAVYSIDNFGDLTPVATASYAGVASFSGVAFSE
ncbi:MAG: hypothetical protein ABSH52_14030 [Terriglobia bacterium]